MASAPTYCTTKEFRRIFPQIDEFDQKTPVYNWTTESISGDTYYVAYDSGLMTQLFIDGKSQQSGNQTIATVKTDDAEEAIDATETAIDITLHSDWTANTFIKIDDEIMYVESATNDTQDTITVVRGVLGTTATTHDDGADIFLHFQPSANGDNLYDSDNDFIILKYGSDPNDNLTEVGEDFDTMVSEFRVDASRYLDSRLDPKLPKNMWKNEAGEFDYMIVRTTALYAAGFMIRTKDPTSEIAAAIILEADNNVQLLNEGRAALGFQNTGDASKGIIRDITYTAGKLRPVDLKGRAGSVDYDRIKIQVIAGGNGFGTDTYSVWTKDSDQLKNNQVVTAEKITGDYQPLAYGLQVRFGGNDENDTAAANDEWEVEVRGYNEEVDTADLKGIKMTRRRYY